ncbi:putative Ig domain-containing protein [Luteolibacter arcticus]|uniref:Ig domain-containing protein n=1 Tax=Luteolibacter arcticus TaxID=1581411 RepID=A0ABT3GBP8_9BACT|nr:Calx-beta domain-containing protein [Luteolibacter arcticus]MCW1921047.1 putative Ig domain-containing protein [Luteolibacter arcticus]
MKTRQILLLSAASLGIITAITLWPNSAPPIAVPVSQSAPSRPAKDASASTVAAATPEAGSPVEETAGEVSPDFGAWARETPPEPDFAKIEAFDGWVARWKTATPDERAAMAKEGAQLAAGRRPEFKALIASDPRLALEKAVPRVVRQDLPQEIVAQLESPVSSAGTLNVYQGRPADGMELRGDQLTVRYFETGGVSYKARVFGQLEHVTSRKDVPLQGVAVDREMAIAENAVRPLELGERIPAGTVVEETCPVSGETTEAVSTGEAVTDETPTVEVAGRVITLCNGSHVTVLEEEFRTWIQASGPGGAGFFVDNFPGTSSRAIGNLRCLYIRVTYPEQISAPNTEEEAHSDMRNTARYFLENSYGKMTTTTTVTSLVTLPHTMAWYKAKDSEVDGLGLIHNESRSEARKLGYDSNQYDCTIVRINGGPRLEGISWGGGSSVWITWGGMDVLNHECGHSLGRNHANYWTTTDGTAYGNGSNQEYGNSFDVMGGGGGFSAHYNTISKRALGWLPAEYVHTPKTNGVYRIHAYDQPQLEEGKRYALTVAKDSIRQYNIEFHPARGGLLADSALVLYSGMGSNAGHLLDTTPGSAGGKGDGGIAIGRTYSDLEADMHFTVLGKNASSPPSLDVAYFRGPFPGNNAPTLALNASATTIAAGGSVTFTATAADADGDALAYHWDFDDGATASNSAVVTRTFATAAQVTAMLTVSDLKGGTARRHMVINVGSHGKQTVTGAVTWNAQALQGVRVSNGTKYAFTDASGNYSLSGLNTGANTLTATLNGYTFTPSFTNPLGVVAGTNTANWTAGNSTFVTLAKTADPVEGGANGTFTLTRTGDTSADLIVRVSPTGGTAAKTTDYTFTPDHATDGSYRTFTIPAGQASLAVAVAAVNDTAQEGPETITLQLASTGEYLSNAGNSMVMTVGDNDTTLPQVAVVSNDPYATEASADAGSFTFTRTGSTAAALNVSVAWTGTATNGADVTTLPATVTIPSGQASYTLAVSPLNDSAIEIPETVIATVNTSAAYVRDGGLQTATVTLSDDDTPVVTVSLPDASASEAGPDSGLFLIHRTGSTAAALKVYYGVHGTALHGTDYGALNGEVIIPAGATSAPVVIAPYNDDLGEPAESVVLAVTTFNNGYSLGSAFQGTVTIADNADVPVISLRAGTVGAEGGSNPTVVFRAVGSGGGNVTVNYTVSGTATSGSDFTALSGSVSIPATGTNDVTVSIPVTNDTTAESTETVVVTITPNAAYKIYNSASAEAIIRDNDSGGDRVMVSTANQSPAESGATGQFYFSRTGTTGALTVNYAVSGTATNGTDYASLPGTVIIPDGATGMDLLLTPTDDAAVEGTETVTLTVLPGTGYGPDRPASATYLIADSESPAISVGFQAATVTVSEADAGGEYRNIPVTLSAASTDTVTVDYTANGGSAEGDDVDWAFVTPGNVPIPGGTLTFAPGVTSQNLRIRIKNDGVMEPVETATLELRAPRFASLSSGTAKQSLLIFDDAPSALVLEERWSGGTVYTNQSWSTNTPNYAGVLYSFTPGQDVADSYSRRLVGQIVAPVSGTYKFWIASDDASRLYLSTTSSAAQKAQIASVSGYTNFQAWDANASQASANITLTAGQSYYMEVQHQEGGGGDHVSVAWQGPNFTRTPITLATPQSTAPRFVRLASAATTRSEADGSEPLLMVLLDRPAGSTPVTVNYTVGGTATAGSDYTLAPGTLTFAAGEQVKTLPLSILADAIGESPEAIVVSLSNPSGAQLTSPSTHVITLRDTDVPTVEALFATATSAMSSGTVIGTSTATPASGRSITGWAIVAGNTGNAFAINASGQVSLVTPAALPNPGGVQLVVRAFDNAGSSGDGVVNVICNAPANKVVEQRWNGGSAYDSEDWTGTPAFTGTLANFTTGQNVADNYSRRLTGYLKPATTGDYTFWIAGDDDCRLYLSSNGSHSNKTEIASVDGWTNFQAWDSQAVQKSAVIPLVAGKVYWLEAHHKEGGGGDHVSVAWQGPGISRQAIPAGVMFPNVAGVNFENPPVPPSIALTSPANGAEFDSGDAVTLDAAVAGGSLAVSTVEFYRGATLIGSDNNPPYSVTWSSAVAGNHVLTAKATYTGGGVTSSGVTIAVADVDPAGDPDGDGFTTGLELALGTNPNSSASQPSSLYANLRAWWKLDESSGTNADDTTGRLQDGTVSGAAWSSGTFGNALSFDGVDDGVFVGTSAAVLGSGNFSLAAWVKVTPGSPVGTVIQQRDPGASGHLGEYMVNVNANGTVNFFVYNNDVYQFNLTTTAAVNDGQWHHVVALRDGTSGKIFIDGVESASGSGTIQALLSRSVSIGYDHRDSNKRFTGMIDDVRIYERALSPGELDTLSPNRAPIFTADPVVKSDAAEDGAYAGSLSGDVANPDSGETLTFSKVTGPAWLSVAADGTLSGTPGNGDVGPNSFTIRVEDGAGLADDAALSIAVTNTNDAPVFAADPIAGSNATEDAAYSGSLSGTASDVDAGDTLSYSKVSGPAWLTVASNGTLGGTPGNDDVGANSFTVRVTDGGLTDDAVLNIAVANVNDAPGFTADPIAGAAATEDQAYAGSLSATANDIDTSDTLTFSKVSGPSWLTVTANGALSGTPSNAEVGANAFTVRVTDGAGAYDEAALNISVANVNDAPVLTLDPITREAGAEQVAYAGTSLAGAAVDGDAGDSVTYSKFSGPGWLTVAASGALSGTPPAGTAGSNVFIVRATDVLGAYDEATLTIDIVGPSLPLPWDESDVGSGIAAGSSSHSAGIYTVSGAGALGNSFLGSRNDAFRFVWQTLSGDGEITARINALQATGTSSRVGVMIRDTLASNSRHVFMGMTDDNDYRWVRRTSNNGNTSTTSSSTSTVPSTWVRLVRVGNTITAYKSSNGSSWTQVGSVSASLPANCYVGLVVASGTSGGLNTSQFSNVSVTP